jgi:hypothetical protein
MGKRSGKPEPPKRKPLRIVVLAALTVAVLAGAAVAWRSQVAKREAGTVVTALARRETGPTLDPALFVGKARVAHEIAREIPDTLDQLYCYCYCDKHMGHKSLLSCYTDGHAAT